MARPIFKPLPDVKTVMRGLQLMALEQPPCGLPVSARQRYYSEGALMHDYLEQFTRYDNLDMPPVNVVRVPVAKPKTVYEPEKPVEAKPGGIKKISRIRGLEL